MHIEEQVTVTVLLAGRAYPELQFAVISSVLG
jgi:hypothetical protein